MGMQTDVLSGHLEQSGFIIPFNRSRLKAVSFRGTASVGQIDFFASDAAPVSATYGQSGTTITVTKTDHGLQPGQKIGISYVAGSGGAGVCGNIIIATVPTSDTFTYECINAYTITGSPACFYVTNGYWMTTFNCAAADTFNNFFLLPGEGILAEKKIYVRMSNINSTTIFYG
jgi:hypothetical protein